MMVPPYSSVQLSDRGSINSSVRVYLCVREKERERERVMDGASSPDDADNA